jgi:flagellar motor switch protein FliG
VLNSIDDDLRTNILIALSDIKKLPLSVIKEIGIRYAKKAREVAGLEDVNVDGLQALLETLDELDMKRQVSIIDTMRASDLEKGERLEKMFIGMNGLLDLDEEILRTALNDVDTQNLINSLHGLDEKLQDHVLKARPPRERELIKSELGALNSISQKEQISSRRDILQMVRKIMMG